MYVDLSVILPCYNSESTIMRAIHSIACQTNKPKELIVIDDGSRDDTLKIIHHASGLYSNTISILVISIEKNIGPSGARNRGWELARYPYIAFLDADDSWHPKKIELQYGWMFSRPNVALSGHPASLYDPKTCAAPFLYPLSAKQVQPFAALFKNPFSTPTVMMKRDIALHFEEGKRYVEDYQLWLQIILSGHPVFKLNLPLTYLHKARFGEAGLSSQLWTMEKGELQTYAKLYDMKLIGPFGFVFFSMISMFKYLKRLFSCRLNRFLFAAFGRKRFLY